MIGALVIFIVREKAGTQPCYGTLHPLRSNNGREFACACCRVAVSAFCRASLSRFHSLTHYSIDSQLLARFYFCKDVVSGIAS